jgi:murein DD-endopeptidase MepM/ murein hydrolase activator NlpD
VSPTDSRRHWHTALAGVALVVGVWFESAATMQPAPMAMSATPPATAALVLAIADAVAAPTTANAALAVNSRNPTIPADPYDSSDLSRLRGRSLILPITGVSAAQLSDTYAQARAVGAAHEALDIMAPRGTPVLAVEDGRVAKLFLSKPGGVTLYQIDPGGEYAYYYAHLDRYAENIAEGASLRKGQVIAYVGSTGNASPDAPHLHFAIFRLGPQRQWWRGTPLNPFLVWRDARP